MVLFNQCTLIYLTYVDYRQRKQRCYQAWTKHENITRSEKLPKRMKIVYMYSLPPNNGCQKLMILRITMTITYLVLSHKSRGTGSGHCCSPHGTTWFRESTSMVSHHAGTFNSTPDAHTHVCMYVNI